MAGCSGVVWYDTYVNPYEIEGITEGYKSTVEGGVTVTVYDDGTPIEITVYGELRGIWFQDYAAVPIVQVPDEQFEQLALQALSAKKARLGVARLPDEEGFVAWFVLAGIAAVSLWITLHLADRLWSKYNKTKALENAHYRDQLVYYDNRHRDENGNLIPIYGYKAYLAFLQAHYPGDYSWLQDHEYSQPESAWWEGIFGFDIKWILIAGLAIVGLIVAVNVLPALFPRKGG